MKTTLTYRILNLGLVLAVLLSAHTPLVKADAGVKTRSVAGKEKKADADLPLSNHDNTVIKAALGPVLSPAPVLWPQFCNPLVSAPAFNYAAIKWPPAAPKFVLRYFKILFVSLICVNAP